MKFLQPIVRETAKHYHPPQFPALTLPLSLTATRGLPSR